MMAIPTRWVTITTEWGEGKKHLYSHDVESIKFHTTEDEARKHADREIQRGEKMVAVMEIKRVLVAKTIDYNEIT